MSLSLYIHIPFCVRKCRYCDFYSIPYERQLADQYIEALSVELSLRIAEHQLNKPVVDTIFFGGGTPSLLSIDQWNTLTESLKRHITLASNYEWSIECNPESFTSTKALAWYQSGVTRLTFGVQSMNPGELSTMGRIHTQQRVLDVLEDTSLQKFGSIGVDIIYGLPGQTIASLRTTLDTMLSNEIIRHISIYELTINGDTPFGRHQSLLPLPDEDILYDMTCLIFGKCKDAGFEQYEISNFARPGYRCRHNESYWNHDPYIGLGCAAHSYIPPFRYANHNDIIAYVQSLQSGVLPGRDSEHIDSEVLAREMIFLGIRRSDGIDQFEFESGTGLNFLTYAGQQTLSLMIGNGLLYQEGSRWKPTPRGILTADAIARELIRYESAP